MHIGIFPAGVGQGVPAVFESKCFLRPLSTTHNSYNQTLNFENGGISVTRSMEGYKSYTLEFQGGELDWRRGNMDALMALYQGGMGLDNNNCFFIYEPANDGRNILPLEWRTYSPSDPTPWRRTLYPGAVYSDSPGVGFPRGFMIETILNPDLNTVSTETYLVLPPNKGLHLFISVSGGVVEVSRQSTALNGSWIPALTTSSNIAGSVEFTSGGGAFDSGEIIRIRTVRNSSGSFYLSSAWATYKPAGSTYVTPSAEERYGYNPLYNSFTPAMLYGHSGFTFNTDSVPYDYTSAVNGVRHYSVDIVEVQPWL